MNFNTTLPDPLMFIDEETRTVHNIKNYAITSIIAHRINRVQHFYI